MNIILVKLFGFFLGLFVILFGIEYINNTILKKYIQDNIKIILPILTEYTFDCPIVYYNKKNDTIRFIKLITPIEWNTYSFDWSCLYQDWKNSSTLKIINNEKKESLLEFQFHNKRTNMAIRWCFENFLTIFKDNLHIENL